MTEDLSNKVMLHDKILFGDPENIEDRPGLIADYRAMSMKQERTNEILTEVRNCMIGGMAIVLVGFLTAVCTLVYKAHG